MMNNSFKLLFDIKRTEAVHAFAMSSLVLVWQLEVWAIVRVNPLHPAGCGWLGFHCAVLGSCDSLWAADWLASDETSSSVFSGPWRAAGCWLLAAGLLLADGCWLAWVSLRRAEFLWFPLGRVRAMAQTSSCQTRTRDHIAKEDYRSDHKTRVQTREFPAKPKQRSTHLQAKAKAEINPPGAQSPSRDDALPLR